MLKWLPVQVSVGNNALYIYTHSRPLKETEIYWPHYSVSPLLYSINLYSLTPLRSKCLHPCWSGNLYEILWEYQNFLICISPHHSTPLATRASIALTSVLLITKVTVWLKAPVFLVFQAYQHFGSFPTFVRSYSPI